ncbi:agmatine deiminase family protein [Salinibacterium sp. TMP30]|uniref:agmatine deiminase family protein n=1 Tax=Salinibacterium sp. TMP30 TaxID=3138237 RepID=UPI003138D746
MAWRMPSETARHDRTWMAFPRPGYTLGTDAGSADQAYEAWAAVANAILEFEPVTMVVDPIERHTAARLLSSEIELVETPLDDYWMRDFGPTFVVDDARPGILGGVDWIFNAWGQEHSSYASDSQIGRLVCEHANAELIPSLLVNEGGAIHVDGEGTVLATETVQLDPRRNPYVDKERIEAEFRRTLGASKVVWLPRGLTRDYTELGTRGHVDMVATIPSPGTLLLHEQQNPDHPDHQVMRELRALLSETTDAANRPWNIIDVPAPTTVRDSEGFVDWNYVNHLVVNDGVIACGYGEPAADAAAREILAAAYPGRRVVTVDARPILERGGGIHCITQQQPAVD